VENLLIYVFILSMIMVLLVWHTVRTTRPKSDKWVAKNMPANKGRSEFKYTGPRGGVPAEPTHDRYGHKYLKYVPPEHSNRRARRHFAKVARGMEVGL
jgi:hypothetical protein